MSESANGPLNERRGRGARERLLNAAHELFRDRGINRTGMDVLCASANVSKRTAYAHFGGKDGLVAQYLHQHDVGTMPDVLDRDDLTPRQHLVAAFDTPTTFRDGALPLCPFIAAAVEIADPAHPARVRAHDYKRAVAARFAATARLAGAADPELLGEQLALLLDGASTRTRVSGENALPTAAGIAACLISQAVPTPDAHGSRAARPAPSSATPSVGADIT